MQHRRFHILEYRRNVSKVSFLAHLPKDFPYCGVMKSFLKAMSVHFTLRLDYWLLQPAYAEIHLFGRSQNSDEAPALGNVYTSRCSVSAAILSIAVLPTH